MEGKHYSACEDSPEAIQKCLSCPKPDCDNCLDPKYIAPKRMTDTKRRIKELYDKGLNDSAIARSLGLNASHVSHMRNEMGLPARKKRGPYGPRKPKAVPAV